MRDAAIFDVDGTLCDVSSILHHVDRSHPEFSGRKRHDRFHAEAIGCPPHAQTIEVYNDAVSNGLAILVVTARMGIWALPTMLWLRSNGIKYERIYMRKTLDFRPDTVVKAAILKRIVHDGFNPVLAVDDNPAVITLWESYGIPATLIPSREI